MHKANFFLWLLHYSNLYFAKAMLEETAEKKEVRLTEEARKQQIIVDVREQHDVFK